MIFAQCAIQNIIRGVFKKMKLSQFANVIKADGFYLLHNTLYQTAISDSDEEAAFIDSISDYHSF